MNILRAAWRFSRLLMHVLYGLWMARRFDRLDRREQDRLIRQWHARLLQILAVEVYTDGRTPDSAGICLPNHVSWLDIPLLGSLLPYSIFLSKDEVRAWPVVGRLAAAAGTVFIRRGAAGDSLRQTLLDALWAGNRIVIFAEGTTTRGDDVRRFHGRLLQAGIDADRPFQPVAIRYRLADGQPDYRPAYVDDDTLLLSLWRILNCRSIRVEVCWLSPLLPAEGGRNELARAIETRVRASVRGAAR